MEIYIAKSGKEAGPFTKEQVAGMLDSGMVARGDSVWHEGLPAWIPVHEFLGVRPPVPVVVPDDSEANRFPTDSSQAHLANPSENSLRWSGKSLYPKLVMGQRPYFAVSPAKLVVMSICTLGMYEIYWFYKHWNQIRVTNRQKVLPFLRAMFSIFTCHFLFMRIKDEAQSSGIAAMFSPGLLTFCYIVPSLFWGSSGILCLLGLGSLWALVTVQRVANSLNDHFAPDADRNERYSVTNIVFMAIGGLLFLLVVIGSMARSMASQAEGNDGVLQTSDSTTGNQISELRRPSIAGVYQDGGWIWDFRSNGTVSYTGRIYGMTSGFQGTYNVSDGAVSVVLENGKTAFFEMESNGDLISQGERLPRVR